MMVCKAMELDEMPKERIQMEKKRVEVQILG